MQDKDKVTVEDQEVTIDAQTLGIPVDRPIAQSPYLEECEAAMIGFYDQTSAYAGSEDILAQMALDIQAVAHPDTPFRKSESTPRIG